MELNRVPGALPEELNATIRAFMESRVILTALELDLFTAVDGGATAAAAAARAGTDPRATGMLLNSLVAMGLLSKREGVFRPTEAAARHFVAGGEDDARLATLHLSSLWERWSLLTEAVRGGTAPGRPGEPGRGPEETRSFIAAMDRIAASRTPLTVAAVGAEGARRMLDVGGGSGAYSIAFAKASPRLEVDLLDLPSVLPIAEGHIRAAGLADRVRVRPGDLRTDPLGAGYDLVLVSAICHMLDESENRDLVRRCRDALAPGGRLVVSEFLLDEDGTGPKSSVLFSLNMLVGTKGGASYTEGQIASWMAESGLAQVRRVSLPCPANLVVGVRPRG